MIKWRYIVFTIIAVLVYFCQTQQVPLNTVGMYSGTLPVFSSQKFEGILPCQNCNGIKVSVELWNDENNEHNKTFVLKQTWLSAKGDTTLISKGRWDIVQKDNTWVYSLNYDIPEKIWYLKPEQNQLLIVYASYNEWPANKYHLKKII